MPADEFEFGLDTFMPLTVDETGQPLRGEQVIRNYAVGQVPHEQRMATIERYGLEVIPRVRELLAATPEENDRAAVSLSARIALRRQPQRRGTLEPHLAGAANEPRLMRLAASRSGIGDPTKLPLARSGRLFYSFQANWVLGLGGHGAPA